MLKRNEDVLGTETMWHIMNNDATFKTNQKHYEPSEEISA